MHRARDTSREGEWLDRLEPEKDNLRAVNMWAIANHQAEFAHRFNGYLFAFWIYRISAFETRHWIDAALKLQAAEVTTNSQIAEALALDTAGYLAIGQRDFEYARHCFQRELDIYTAVGQQPGIATGYRGLGFTAMQAGDLEYATAMTTQSLAVSETVDDQWGMAWSLFDLGYLALVRGDYHQARSFSEQALPRLQDQDIQFGLYRALIAHGHILRGLGESQAAQHAYYQALHMQQRLHYTQQLTDVLESLADIATTHGHAEWAASIFGFTQQHSVLITLRWQHLDASYNHALQQTQRQLSAAAWERALRQGQQMSLDQAVAYALAGPRLRSRAQNG
jgi:tetratricopeptide (TPR) repeat protein